MPTYEGPWQRWMPADLRLYHGTNAAHAERIVREGLRKPLGVGGRGWPMLTTNFDQAARYAQGVTGRAVVEFFFPGPSAKDWLWPETAHNVYGFTADAYALRHDHIPPEFVVGVVEVL